MKKILTAIASLAVVTPVVTGVVVACSGVDYTELDKLNEDWIVWTLKNITNKDLWESTTEESLATAMNTLLKSSEKPSTTATIDEGGIDRTAKKVTYKLSLDGKNKTYTYSWA